MDKGVNGMLVVAVVGGGCVARDGRIVPGDYLVSVNNESLRKVTNSQARAILRRTQLLSTDIRYVITCFSIRTNLILAEYVIESRTRIYCVNFMDPG